MLIRDMIFVKQLERRLGRRLNDDEMNGFGFEVRFPDGHYEWHKVPLLAFPHDLMPGPAEEDDLYPSAPYGYAV